MRSSSPFRVTPNVPAGLEHPISTQPPGANARPFSSTLT
jgi:hypothetical protein